MSSRSKDVAKWLKQLLKFRQSEYAQAQEFNGFNYEDNEDFNDETKKISDEIVKIENEAENACQCKVLDIDEAISHAEDIAARGDSVCHKNHNQLASWLRELKDLRSQHGMLKSDFISFKKRVANAESVARDKALRDAVLQFLRTYDDMDILYKEVKMREMRLGGADDDIYSGFQLIFDNLEKTLKSLGCEKIEVRYGDKFDVNNMEALTTRAVRDDEGYDSGDVVSIFRSGWMLDSPTGKVVLRPATVVVGE